MLFGPDSDVARKSIQRRISVWVREDLQDADRLFLLGIWLHFDDDARAPAILEAALRFTDQDQHIVSLLTPTAEVVPAINHPSPTEVTQSPDLNSMPVPFDESPSPSGKVSPPPSPTPDDTSSGTPDRDSEGQLLPPLPID